METDREVHDMGTEFGDTFPSSHFSYLPFLVLSHPSHFIPLPFLPLSPY